MDRNKKPLFMKPEGLDIHRGNLVETTPHPGQGMGHILPYMPSSKIGALGPGDDWGLLEKLQTYGGPGSEPMQFEKPCLACGITHKFVAMRAILPHIKDMKWLCGECRDDGFDWGSNLTPDQMTRYQVVKQYDDDTLVRLIEKSPNHREPEHKPMDIVEEQAKNPDKFLKRKKRKLF
jgi:hypothetical protein